MYLTGGTAVSPGTQKDYENKNGWLRVDCSRLAQKPNESRMKGREVVGSMSASHGRLFVFTLSLPRKKSEEGKNCLIYSVKFQDTANAVCCHGDKANKQKEKVQKDRRNKTSGLFSLY